MHSDIAFDPGLLQRLQRDLLRADYRVEAVGALWGADAAAALHRGNRVPARRALDRLVAAAPEEAARIALARLFLLSDAVVDAEAEAALPALGIDGALALGLLRVDGAPAGTVAAALDLRPYDLVDSRGPASWWILSDLGELALGRELEEDHVLGVGGASLTLAGLMIQRPVRTALDLGTGCGIQAMHASRHADRVVATDISNRALTIARMNAELNGIHSIEFRHGSLYDPVAGERFDHIISNPPFVITPRVEGVPAYEYRDGGLVGDEIVRQVVIGAAAHLTPGGVAQLLGNWEYHDDTDAFDRIRGWLDDTRAPLDAWFSAEPSPLDAWIDSVASPLDVWFVEREKQDPAIYAETWIRDGGTRPGPEADVLTAAWLDDFEQRAVTGVGFGYITLRLPVAGRDREPLRRLERVDTTVTGGTAGLGGHVAHCFDAMDAVRGLDDASLAALALTVAGDITEERHYWPGNDDPTVMTLRQGGGFARSVDLDTALAAVTGACDGELSVAAICAALAELLAVDERTLRADVLPRLRELVADGILLLP
ncbi:methyltransferase [Microbacteriaceae bacterium VKM Ac-2855]|nr:methyltransferase [Microbacteriaceae bacterium VKM Ac-2855]